MLIDGKYGSFYLIFFPFLPRFIKFSEKNKILINHDVDARVGMEKRGILSLFGMMLSVSGVIGVMLSQFMVHMFVSVIAAISGLFTIAIQYNEQW